MRKLFTLVLISTLVACGGPGAGNKAANASNEADTPKTKWEYSESIDEMTDLKTFTAEIEANEKLDFAFPYNGGTKVWLTLYKGRSGTNVALSIPKNKGQFIPSLMGERDVLVRFDDKPAEKYVYLPPADYSTETIFIKNSGKFIENLKTSNQVIVQCEFFNEGVRTIKFDTKGLEWNH